MRGGDLVNENMKSLPVVVFNSSCQRAWRFQEKRSLTQPNLHIEVLHVDLRVHVGVVRLPPFTQGGELAHQEVQGVLRFLRDVLDLIFGRFWDQSQGVGRCFDL